MTGRENVMDTAWRTTIIPGLSISVRLDLHNHGAISDQRASLARYLGDRARNRCGNRHLKAVECHECYHIALRHLRP